MLTDLQKRVAREALSLRQALPFAVAGGAGLIARKVVDRRTNDIDLFASSNQPVAVASLLPVLTEHLRGRGYQVEQIVPSLQERDAGTQFARLVVTSPEEGQVKLELGLTYRLRVPAATELGRTLHEDDLIGDKVLGLWDRASLRDFIDVHSAVRYVQKRGQDRTCLLQLAAAKDGGFDLVSFKEMVGSIRRFGPEHFLHVGLGPNEVRQVMTYFQDWEREICHQIDHGMPIPPLEDLDRGPGL